MKSTTDFRSYFELAPGYIHLNNAGCTPLTTRAVDALAKAAHEQASLGYHCRMAFTQRLQESRTQVANFFGTKPEYLAMTQNCATALSIFAHGLTYKSGDEILTWDQEYPTNAYVWHAVAKMYGAKVVVLESEKNYEMNLDLLLSKINSRTKIVALSWVQSVAGTMIDLTPILKACEKVGAWFVVDAFQGLGAIPFKMSDYPGIVLATGTQKWLCGPFGHGYLAFTDDRYLKLNPVLLGAMSYGGSDQTNLNQALNQSATRFEPGTPLMLNSFATAASISCIEEFGIEKIQQKNILLREHLLKGLDKLDAQIFGSRDSRNSGPHVTFIPRKNLADCEKTLLENKISYVTKAKGFRLSPHAFNTFEELDIALDCFK